MLTHQFRLVVSFFSPRRNFISNRRQSVTSFHLRRIILSSESTEKLMYYFPPLNALHWCFVIVVSLFIASIFQRVFLVRFFPRLFSVLNLLGNNYTKLLTSFAFPNFIFVLALTSTAATVYIF